MGRHAVRPDAAEVDAAQVVPGADRDAVLARVVAARRAIDDVVVVQRGARGARRDGAAPAVARKHGVAVARLGLPLAADVLEDLLAALPERRARWTEGIEGAAEQRHDRRGRGERDVGIERLVMVRTHLPLDGSEGGVRWWRRGREPRVAPVEGPLDLGDEAPERDLARARDPGVVGGGHGEDGQRAQPRDGAPAVGGSELGRPAEPALERDQGAGFARREAEALGDVARRRREAEGAVQAQVEEGAEEDAHLPVDALHGAAGGAQALVEGERVAPRVAAGGVLPGPGGRAVDGGAAGGGPRV